MPVSFIANRWFDVRRSIRWEVSWSDLCYFDWLRQRPVNSKERRASKAKLFIWFKPVWRFDWFFLGGELFVGRYLMNKFSIISTDFTPFWWLNFWFLLQQNFKCRSPIFHSDKSVFIYFQINFFFFIWEQNTLFDYKA